MIETGNENRLPLEGLLVIDMTRLLPGPLCTMLLGDYGAEVIKVEDVTAGDPTRFVGSYIDGKGSFFRQLNRNKKSLALNLKSSKGREVLEKLAKQADVLVEGFRPGVMSRLGLGYDSIESVNPRIVYASISGYGQQGPYRDRAGHDINYTALSGLLDLSAAEDGVPMMPAVQIADIAGGSLMAVNGIMFALYERSLSGTGSYVDLSMTRGLLPWLTYAAAALRDDELPRRKKGHITGAYACYNIYETADQKYMSLGALEPVFWQRFCESVGKPEWISLQFDSESREILIDEVKYIFKGRSRNDWIEHFSAVDACCEPVLNLNEAVNHDISREGIYWIENTIGENEKELLTGFPILFNGRAGSMRMQPPGHGQHTREILEELGYSDKVITKMVENRWAFIPR